MDRWIAAASQYLQFFFLYVAGVSWIFLHRRYFRSVHLVILNGGVASLLKSA